MTPKQLSQTIEQGHGATYAAPSVHHLSDESDG